MESALHILQTYWKHSTFRDAQEKIIQAAINNRNVLSILPTGGGKSICFQIPALIKGGVCIVVSPLIALMEDQVYSLQKKGIKAIALTSKYNREDTIKAFDNLRFGNYKFLYISPEKLQSEFIQEKIGQLKVNLIAVDEAHCISEWGHDFRPAYLKIPILKQIHPTTNIIALTASATPIVIEDIRKNLGLENSLIFKRSFFRENIEINILKTEDIAGKLKVLLANIKEPSIIYTNTRKKCIEISNYLNKNGFKSVLYHGGLLNDEKLLSFERWKKELAPVIVATNAFGMGIDKANVRAVIHLNIPNSIENYLQEIGRAGRDGKRSFAYLFYNDSSIFETKNNLKKGIVTPKFCKEIYARIHQYFQIANGELSEKIYDLDLQNFCTFYNLSFVKVYFTLNLLKNENIIEFQQNANKRSSLKVMVSNSHLFELEQRNPNLYKTLKAVLRNYGGVFEQFITINEDFIAKKLGITPSIVVESLNQLDSDKIIVYKKANNEMQLKFQVPREDNFVIHKISRNIEQRNKIKIEKTKAILDYILNSKVCRNAQLLHYFGENELKDCFVCDNCKKEAKKDMKIDYRELASRILLLFDKKHELKLNDMINALADDKINIIKTLELLIEENTLRLTSHNKIEMIKK